MNQKILKLVEERLEEGKRKYGHENVKNDGRNFEKEALEEALDCSVYLAGQLIEIQAKLKSKKKLPDYERIGDHCI